MLEIPWEDNLLEKKLESDLKDLLKTLVAFSNSVKPGHIATILIGEKDDGTVQGVVNPDNIQKQLERNARKFIHQYCGAHQFTNARINTAFASRSNMMVILRTLAVLLGLDKDRRR